MSAFEVWVDFSCVQNAIVTPQKLRRGFQAIGGEPRFGEDVAFDAGGNGLRLSSGRLGLAAVIQVIWPESLQSHMRPPGVVPAFEFGAQEHQVNMTAWRSVDRSLAVGDTTSRLT